VETLGSREGIFLPANGRLALGAVNENNVEFIAQAIANVLKD
jgi:aspartate/tyrosine/aromatic aminotransferase